MIIGVVKSTHKNTNKLDRYYTLYYILFDYVHYTRFIHKIIMSVNISTTYSLPFTIV